LTQNPLSIDRTGHDLYEQHDKDTIKQVCVSCGTKGYYLLIQGVPGINEAKGVLVECDQCENGYKYRKLLKEQHGVTE